MITFFLARCADTPMGTFGRLIGTNGFECWTVERPWLDNAENVSCIPTGLYRVERGVHKPGTAGAYPCLELLDVPGRSAIEIHIANRASEVEGCIGVGRKLGNAWDVIDSRVTFDRLMESVPLLANVEIRIAWTIPRQSLSGGMP